MTERADAIELSKKELTKEELRKSNLKWFAAQFPGYHAKLKNYEPLSQLVEEGGDWFNIKFSGQLLYRPSAQEQIEKQHEGFENHPYRLSMDPLQPEFFDHYAANFLHKIIERINDEEIEFSAYIPPFQSYYLIVFGVGLGAHLEALVEKTNCQCLILLEPNIEFIFQSLEIFDWQKLHKTIEKRGGYFDVITIEEPHTVFERIKNNIRLTNPCSFDGTIMFTHYSNDMFELIDQRIKSDANLILSGMGFYFDETVMLSNTHENLRSGDAQMIRFTRDVLRTYPVFIVATGPSLDKNIEWLQNNQDKAIIFSCGSAIMPLLRAGIQPDFQVEVENIPELYDMFIDTVKYVDVSKIHLLTTTTIDSRVPAFFEKTSYFFRPALSSFPVFAQPKDAPLENGSPTVLNAAVALAQNFGFRELYLFGADMGIKTKGLVHSKNAWQNTDEGWELDIKFDLPVRGNFGGTVYSHSDMNWTRDELERAIRQLYNGRFYFNCSDGAYIKGTLAKHPRSIKFKDHDKPKSSEISNIVETFERYTKADFDARWNDANMCERFADYCNRLIACFDDPADVTSKRALTEVNKFLASYHETGLEMGVAMIFRGTVWQALMAAEYYVNRVDGKEERARADEIFKDEIVHLIEHLRKIAIDDLGHLSEHEWVPRKRILDIEREDWDSEAP